MTDNQTIKTEEQYTTAVAVAQPLLKSKKHKS